MPGEIRGLSPEQLARLRQTLEPAVDDWLRDYCIPRDKTHQQLVNRVVAAVVAMHQCSVIEIQPGNGK